MMREANRRHDESSAQPSRKPNLHSFTLCRKVARDTDMAQHVEEGSAGPRPGLAAQELYDRERRRKGFTFAQAYSLAEEDTVVVRAPGPGYYIPRDDWVTPRAPVPMFSLSDIYERGDSYKDDNPSFIYQNIEFKPSGVGFRFGSGLREDRRRGANRPRDSGIVARNIELLGESRPARRLLQILKSKRIREAKQIVAQQAKESSLSLR